MAERILIVDDSEAKRYALGRSLRAAGFQVEEALDGEAALTQARTSPALILLDIRLPRMSGLEVARRLRGDPATASIPIIHVSATKVTEDDRALGLENGADAYLVTPVDGRVLVATVGALLRASRAERALRDASERLFDILESAPDGFVSLDEHLNVTFFNRALKRRMIPGTSLENAQSIWSALPELKRPEIESILLNAMLRGGRDSLETRVQAMGGGWFNLRPFRIAGGVGLFFEDVTERLAREETERQRAEFGERLLGIISHDLRTPLSAISISAESIERATESEKIRRMVQRIRSSTLRATRLISQMMEWTQASIGGGLPIVRKQGDLVLGFRQALAEIQAGNPGRQFALELPVQASGEWDLDRLSQAFANLLANAVAHSQIESVIACRVDLQDGWAEIRIENKNIDGPIPKALLPKLFDPFKRGTPSTRNRSGVGLGLYIVREVVRGHGGSVEVSSDDEKTCFLVRLPLSVSTLEHALPTH